MDFMQSMQILMVFMPSTIQTRKINEDIIIKVI